MSSPANRQLSLLMQEFGYTQESLAERINETAALFCGGGLQPCTDRNIRRWLSGQVRWPHARYLVALEHIFGRPAHEIGFVPRGKSSVVPKPPAPLESEEDPVLRRRFVTASTAATFATTLGIDETPQQGRISMGDVGRVNERIDRLEAEFFAIGGSPLVEVAVAYITRLRAALDGCSYSDRVEKELLKSISSLYCKAGWGAWDSDNIVQASRMHSASLQSALVAGDSIAAARAWSALSIQARLEGRHREAVQIVETALSDRRARQDPYICTLLHARLACGHARNRDRSKTARALLRAEQAYDRVPVGGPPAVWLNFLNAAEVSGLAAHAQRELGSYDHAEAAATQALGLLPPALRRSRAYIQVQLAELQVLNSEREGAAATLAEIETPSLVIPRLTGRITAVRRIVAAA